MFCKKGEGDNVLTIVQMVFWSLSVGFANRGKVLILVCKQLKKKNCK